MATKKSAKLAAAVDGERAEALSAFLAQMHKENPGEVMRLNDSTRVSIDVVPTGAISLDVAIGAGGFPRGKIIELFGGEGGGKTTVALTVAMNAQKTGANIGFIDAEHGLNRALCNNIGIDPERFVVFQPDHGEQAIDMVEQMIRSKAFDVIIVDSIAAMTPKAEIDADIEQQFMGLHARLMSKFMRRVAGIANENGVMLILVNQIRKNLQAYGTPDETTGGKAIKFYASLRIEVRTSGSKKITRGGEIVGHTVVATVKKNRLGPPHTTAEFDLIYGQGVDASGALLDVAEKVGVLLRSGAYYTEAATGERLSEMVPGEKPRVVVGKEAAKDLLRRDTELRERITAGVYAALEGLPVEVISGDGHDEHDDHDDHDDVSFDDEQ
jgi:recombination protein RecA